MMIARSATKAVTILRCRGVRHSERMIFPQPFGVLVLQMNCKTSEAVNGWSLHNELNAAVHLQNTLCGHMGFDQRFLNWKNLFYHFGCPVWH